ncbi:hypothetical protein AB4559_03275 [Vibrio sp. 10N.222.51.C8]|uniref:hypothetical protein n=1 Tax=Vibrio sp. 10N.222.51.C8 TaxID=3229624 RepID=UPI00354F7B59
MRKRAPAKVAVPTTIFGNHSIPFSRPFTGVFRYKSGGVCWPVTDFFADKQRGPLANSSLEQYFAPLQDIVDFMSSLKPNDPSYQFTGASDKMFLDFREWLKKNTNLNNKQINKRLRHLIDLLFYIQEEYDAETSDGGFLIRAKGDDIPVFGVEVTKKKDNRGNEYYHHTSFLNAGDYTQRSPVTGLAMDEVISIIKDHSEIDSEQALYNSEVLRLSTDIFQATGIRVGELAHMGQAALELLQMQLDEDDKTLGEIADSPDSILKKYFTKSEINEVIEVIRTYMTDDREIIWLLIVTNKSVKNAGKPRLLPIGRPLAEDIVDFYEDYVLDMIDLDSDERKKINRSECGYIIPKYDGKPFFNESDVHDDTDEDSDGDGKLFSSFYSNKIGRIAKEKVSPHLYRHRFITNIVVSMMDGADAQDKQSMLVILTRVSKITGHYDPMSLWSYIEKGRVSLQNKALVKKKQINQQVETLLNKYGFSPESPLAKDLKLILD